MLKGCILTRMSSHTEGVSALPSELWQIIAQHRPSTSRPLRSIVAFDRRTAAATAIQLGWRRAALVSRWAEPVGGVHGSNREKLLSFPFIADVSPSRRSVYLEGGGGFRFWAAHACTKREPPPQPARPLTFLLLLVLRADERGKLPASDAVSMRVVGFEPGEKGYERLPLHPARQHEEEEEDSVDSHYDERTTEQLDLDPELDDTGHTPSSACVTTEWACFDKVFKRGSSTSMVKTLMRIEVHAGAAAGADGGGAPFALFHLEDEFVTRVHLPAVSARAQYRLIVSLSYRGYVRLLSPAQAAAIGGRTQERCL